VASSEDSSELSQFRRRLRNWQSGGLPEAARTMQLGNDGKAGKTHEVSFE